MKLDISLTLGRYASTDAVTLQDVQNIKTIAEKHFPNTTGFRAVIGRDVFVNFTFSTTDGAMPQSVRKAFNDDLKDIRFWICDLNWSWKDEITA